MNEIKEAKFERIENCHYAKYKIIDLERGFGITLGNSLKRILLNSFKHVLNVVVDVREEDGKDILVLTISTDGVISPDNVLNAAAKKLKEYFEIFI